MTNLQTSNRENWLNKAGTLLICEIIQPTLPFETIPLMAYSLTAPRAKQTEMVVLGECWSRAASKNEHNAIFITATLGEQDSALILATLLHEQLHAIDDNQHGHGIEFQKLCQAVGLEGGRTARSECSYTSTVPSLQLRTKLDDIVEFLGAIPHTSLTPALSGKKTQKNRQLLVACNECGFKFRASRTAIDSIKHHDCLACDTGRLLAI